jgi:hypothetical protein
VYFLKILLIVKSEKALKYLSINFYDIQLIQKNTQLKYQNLITMETVLCLAQETVKN